MYSSNRASDILQTVLQKVPANLFLLFSWSYSVLYCWGNETVSQSQLFRELPEKMLCPWTVKMIFHFLLLLKKWHLCTDILFGLLCLMQWSHMNTSSMLNKVQIIVCAYCSTAGLALVLQCSSHGIWMAFAVQKTMDDIGGLSSLTQNHRFTQSQNGWSWMGPLEII